MSGINRRREMATTYAAIKSQGSLRMADARKLLGIPPYIGVTNDCAGDGDFSIACERKWGKKIFKDTCEEAQRLHKIGMAGYNKALADAKISSNYDLSG
jgi:hypothetical protein